MQGIMDAGGRLAFARAVACQGHFVSRHIRSNIAGSHADIERSGGEGGEQKANPSEAFPSKGVPLETAARTIQRHDYTPERSPVAKRLECAAFPRFPSRQHIGKQKRGKA